MYHPLLGRQTFPARSLACRGCPIRQEKAVTCALRAQYFYLSSTEEIFLCNSIFCLVLVLIGNHTENFVVMTTKEIHSKTTFYFQIIKEPAIDAAT